jgi:hypothetical protein
MRRVTRRSLAGILGLLLLAGSGPPDVVDSSALQPERARQPEQVVSEVEAGVFQAALLTPVLIHACNAFRDEPQVRELLTRIELNVLRDPTSHPTAWAQSPQGQPTIELDAVFLLKSRDLVMLSTLASASRAWGLSGALEFAQDSLLEYQQTGLLHRLMGGSEPWFHLPVDLREPLAPGSPEAPRLTDVGRQLLKDEYDESRRHLLAFILLHELAHHVRGHIPSGEPREPRDAA